MKGRKTRYYDGEREEESDKFETEALSFLNTDAEGDRTKKTGQESDSDELGGESSDDEPTEDNAAAAAEDGDSDEAPDDVGFHDSKQSIMTQLRSALRQVDGGKKTKKEQRRKLDAQFKQQKAQKRKELSNAKLPAEFLDDLPEAVPSKKSRVSSKSSRPEKSQHKTDNTGEEDSGLETEHPDLMSEDYIAFSDSGVQVAALQKIEKDSKSVAQIAADFRHKRLYGNNIRRESIKSKLAQAEKRKYRHR